MNRPDDVTEEDLARWRAQAERFGSPETPMIKKLFPAFQIGDYRERWCAGEWLHRQLDDLGCDSELASRICFAHGQMAFHVDDPWPSAEQAVANFRVGKWEVPGPKLAARLFEEHFPAMIRKFGPPDITAMLELVQSPEFKKPLEHPFPYDPV